MQNDIFLHPVFLLVFQRTFQGVQIRRAYIMTSSNKGFDPMTGLYTTRYYARKACTGDCIVVKVCGGYTVMTASDYNTWRQQR